VNFTFANPYFLILAFVALAFGFFYWLKKDVSNSVMKAALPLNFQCKHGLFESTANVLPLVLRISAVVLLILALARPQEVERAKIAPVKGVDIMLCIDTSASMNALDFEPHDRIAAAKKTAGEFIKKRVNDRIAIVVFAENAVLVSPLTLDYNSLLEFLDNVYVGMIPANATAIGDAIATGVNHLKDSDAKSKVMVLLTDGRSNAGEIANPVLAAKAAKEFGIKIYAIGTAGKGPAKIPIPNAGFFGASGYAYTKEDLDEETLTEIAQVSGGKFYRAKNYKELQNIYSKIDSLERTEFKGKTNFNYNDKYAIFILPAILLLILEFLLRAFVFIKVP